MSDKNYQSSRNAPARVDRSYEEELRARRARANSFIDAAVAAGSLAEDSEADSDSNGHRISPRD